MTGTGSGPLHEAWQAGPPPPQGKGLKGPYLWMRPARRGERGPTTGQLECGPAASRAYTHRLHQHRKLFGAHSLPQGCHGTGPIFYHRVFTGRGPIFCHLVVMGGDRPQKQPSCWLTIFTMVHYKFSCPDKLIPVSGKLWARLQRPSTVYFLMC